MAIIFKITFNKPTNVCYFKADGTKVDYAIPNNPEVDDIVADIHGQDEDAVIMMHRESDGRIHIIPGKNPMSDDARNALMTKVDAWLSGLDTARYTGKKDTMSFTYNCANGGCIAQPPKKSALTQDIKDGTRTAILNWTYNASTAAPASGAPSGGTTPPSGGTTPPSGGTTPPSGGTTPPSGGTTPPSGGTTPPSGGTTPSDDMIAGANLFRAACEKLGYKPVSWKVGERLKTQSDRG